MEEFDDIIVLNDEDGNEVRFEFLDIIEYKGEEFVFLLPVEDESGEITVLKIADTDDPDEDTYVGIEDNDLLQKVFGLFKEKYKEELGFEN